MMKQAIKGAKQLNDFLPVLDNLAYPLSPSLSLSLSGSNNKTAVRTNVSLGRRVAHKRPQAPPEKSLKNNERETNKKSSMSHLRGVKKEWEEERRRETGRERQSEESSASTSTFNANFLSIIVPYLDTFAFINRLPFVGVACTSGRR